MILEVKDFVSLKESSLNVACVAGRISHVSAFTGGAEPWTLGARPRENKSLQVG